MTNRQRMAMALACRPGLDCLPVLPWGLDAMATPPDPSFAPLWRALLEKAVIKRRWTSWFDAFTPAPPVQVHTQPVRHSGSAWIEETALSGPGGELQQTVQGIPGTTASEKTSHFLKTEDDIRLYLSWPFAAARVDVAPYFELERSVGERGVVTYRLMDALGVAGGNLAAEFLALLSVDNEPLLMRLIETLAERIHRHVQALLEAGARPIFHVSGSEYATPPLLRPRQFDDYVMRFDQPLLALMHRYGCKVLVHCHGRANGVLERFIDMGVDGLHPLEAPPMGDITLAEAERRVGDKLCLVGNLQIGDMMRNEPSEIREQVLRIREDVPTGMILSTSATPYETVLSQRLLENYLVALDAAAE